MSFYTSLKFYRPTKPPIVTGRSLSELVSALRQTGAFQNKMFTSLQVKFGDSIDQDAQPSSWEEPVTEDGSIVTYRDIEWDVDRQVRSLEEAEEELARYAAPLYRAYVSLGAASSDVIDSLQRMKSPENKVDLTLCDWSLQIGPVEICDLGSEESSFVGWMSLGISGQGYLFPWTFPELVGRAEKNPWIRSVTELCRYTWPVEPATPGIATQEQRQQLGALWPYDELDLPWDWYWGLEETG